MYMAADNNSVLSVHCGMRVSFACPCKVSNAAVNQISLWRLPLVIKAQVRACTTNPVNLHSRAQIWTDMCLLICVQQDLASKQQGVVEHAAVLAMCPPVIASLEVQLPTFT